MKYLYPQLRKSSAIIAAIALLMLIAEYSFSQDLLPFSHNKSSNTLIQDPQADFRPEQNVSTFKNSEILNEYSFAGAMVYDSHYGNDDYDVLSIPDFSSMSEPGKPALPVHVDNVLLPGNARATIEIVAAESQTYTGYNIQPALTPAIDTEGADEPEFIIDRKLYSTDAFFPAQPVYITSQQFLRGNKLISVAIAPVQFNPVTKTLKVFTKIKYKVSYQGGSDFQQMQQENSDHYLDMFRNISINSGQIPATSAVKTTSSSSPNYLIITHDNYRAAADTLAKWKSMLGYRTEIISSASWTSAMVKDSIHTRYAAFSPKPDYFVIIGDHEDVPAEIHQAPDGTYFGTDLYFACMDGSGDYVPDMAHGRISVSDSTMAMTVILKTVNYERNPVVDASFYNKATNCAYFQGYEYMGQTYCNRRFLHTSEDVHSYLSAQGYTIDRIYETESNLNPTHYQNGYYSDGQAISPDILRSNGFQWDGNSIDISNSINDGRFYVFHRDHGYTDGWGWSHPFFANHPTAPNVQNLANGNKLPVVFSINCHTGEFTQPEAFAETFLRHTNGGAVGVVAPSYYSYSGPNDGFAAGLFDAIWSNPGLVPDFGSGGVSNPSLSAHSDIHAMGDVVNQALIRMMETWPGYGTQARYTHELYHYFGDPAMRIFTAKPTAITADVQDTATGYSVQISNANIGDALATLYVDGKVIATTTLSNGNGTLSYQDSIEANAVLTISGHNTVPLMKTIRLDNVIKQNPPATQASNIKVKDDSTKSISLTVTWEPGDGDHRMVKINDVYAFTDPVDGTEYTPDNFYHHKGEQVVYVGEGSEVTVYNLDENTVYWFRVYEYNNEGVYTKYTTIEESGNPTNQLDDSPFPVELLDFGGIQKNSAIQLNWSTASEVNNDHFVIEKISGENVLPLGKITGAGMSNELKYYTFDDNNPRKGVNYYRLKQVDYNGNSEIFETIAVEYDENHAISISSVYQQGDELVFDVGGPIDGDIQIQIHTVDGRLLTQKQLNNDNAQNGKLRVSVPGHSQGYYILRLLANNQSITRKFAIY